MGEERTDGRCGVHRVLGHRSTRECRKMTSGRHQDPVSAVPPSYRDARSHYLSPKRRDPVKTLMEEVVSHQVFADAVQRLALAPDQPLRVLDLGCGVGDGLNLLTQTHGHL